MPEADGTAPTSEAEETQYDTASWQGTVLGICACEITAAPPHDFVKRQKRENEKTDEKNENEK